MRKSLFLCASVGAVAVASPAMAQAGPGQGPEQAAADERIGLADIVVTAQKRAEDVQSTPISIGVVTGRDIALKAQNNLDAVLRDVPSVEVQGLAQGAQLYIRGVGSSVDPGFADPSVALMVDGAYNGRTESVTSGSYDIDRVEVLRGPQGTLYGRNASGGSVNVITANPRLEEGVSGHLRGQLGNYDHRRIEGALNLGVNENLAFRVAGFREKRDGYVDDGSYNSDAWGLRAKALARPTDWLTLLFKADIFREKGLGANTVPVPGSAGNLTFPPPYFFSNFDPTIVGGPPFTGGVPIPRFPNGWEQRDPGNPWSNNPEHTPGSIDRKAETFQLQLDADLGFATLTVLPAYSRNRNFLQSSFLFGSILPGAGPTYTINSNYEAQAADTKYKSVEVRLASNGGGPFKYLLGFYYLKTDGGAPLNAQTITTNNGDTGSFDQQILPGSTIAGFGQLTYALTDRLRLTGGLRVSRDKNAQEYEVVVAGTSTGVQTYSSSQSSTQYKLGMEYDVADRSMLYAHVATGFKQGGIAATVPPISFKPEHLTSFEVGIKNRFWDNRVQLNLAAFHYHYKNYQFSVFQELPVGTSGATANFPVIKNAGSTDIQGAEMELDAAPWALGRIKASLTWLDAKYGDAVLPNSPFVNQGDFQLDGLRIQNAPKWAANIGVEQGVDLMDGVLTFGVNTHLSTGYHVSPEQYLPGAYQKGYSRTDLSVRYERGPWSLGAVLRNVEDKAQTTYVFPAYRRFVTAPRTFMVTAGLNF